MPCLTLAPSETSSGRFHDDKQVVLAAVKRHGAAFAFASDNLKADPEVLLVAVEQDALAMLHADSALRASKVRKPMPSQCTLACIGACHGVSLGSAHRKL